MKRISQVVDKSWGEPTIADFPTPYTELNDLMNEGFSYGHITTVAGRTSMGKTALAVDIAAFTTAELGLGVAFFSAEMTNRQVLNRLCIRLSGGDPRPEEMRDTIAGLPMFMDDTPGVRPSQVFEMVKQANDLIPGDGRIHQVIVDYLQLMRPDPGMYDNRNLQIDGIMQGLLAVAKELNVHVLLLAQLNRSPEARRRETGDARPDISDLRDSGTIENTANEILLLYRPEYYDEYKTGNGTTELIIGKNREGQTGVVTLQFTPQEMRFRG